MQTALEKLREIRSASGVEGAICRAAESKAACFSALNGYTEYSEMVSDWNQAASDVLDIIVKAGQPVTHSQFIKQLCRSHGYSKETAKAAIVFCQSKGWMEHNLTTGYVLAAC